MRTIDQQSWIRRDHYQLFKSFNHPHFNMCANVDMTTFYPYIKHQGYSFTIAIVYLISRAANAIPEFRYRIRGDVIVEHEIVSPSITILSEDELFSFCAIDYAPDFKQFSERADRAIAEAKIHPSLEDRPGRDDLLYMTAIPWVSFTSFTHPMQQHPADSIPRFAWGKYFEEGYHIKMPLSVQGHHALMDGIHIGKLFQIIEKYLNRPGSIFSAE